jgi:uncharacterized membrane protein
MSTPQRLVHIDALRGLAVLLMVMVHAAATWNPMQANATPTLLAYLVSGLGGLAAPLFVTLFGWGLAQRAIGWNQRLRTAAFLLACQLLVNISAPHLFEPWTPGVLSLFAVLMVTHPLWSRPWRREKNAHQTFLAFASALFVLHYVLQPYWGPSEWAARVSTPDFTTFVTHLAITGTYPLLPWVVFAALGTAIANTPSPKENESAMLKLFGFGFLLSSGILAYTLHTGGVWALPTGDAMLTFFPANLPFLVAALTGTALLWLASLHFSQLSVLGDVGQCSLSVYVGHFVPFVWMASLDERYAWSLNISMVVTLGYTLGWVVLGTLWHRHAKAWTLESVMRTVCVTG